MESMREVLARGAPELLKRQSDNTGKTASAQGPPVSASQLVSTLIPVLLVSLVWLALFLFARPRYSWNYSPRSQSKLLKPDEYTAPLPTSRLGWVKQFFATPDTYVLQHQTLDAYFFLRFLKMGVVICAVGALITWPILFPVYATGQGGATQLNILTFGNVSSAWRYFATVGCMYLLWGFIFILLGRESIYYVNMRQAYLMNPAYASKLPSRTVLYTAVPAQYLNAAAIRTMLGSQVKNVWFPTDTKELDKIVQERQDDAMKLEGAETKLIRSANESRLKAEKKGAIHDDVESSHPGAMRYLVEKDRPTHKTGLLGLIGKKVDSINWTREEISRLTPIVEEEQAKHRVGDAKLSGAVFVEFDSLGAAQAAYQSLTHHQMLKMAPRWTGMAPAEVIWSNLRIKGPERFVRTWVTTGIVIATIIFWSIPVAVVGIISNINYWIGPDGKTPWLGFLNKIPTVVFGVITGLLPTVLLAVLMALLPPFLRWMAKLGGSPTYGDVEYKTSNYYFGFQVVQVFLVTTLSSAVSGSVFSIISNPGSAVGLLTTGLPKSNSFYLSYIILQGLGVVSGMLASVAGLFVTPLLAKFLGNTPRKLFQRWNGLSSISYGTVFPIYTNLVVIAISYSIIAPLVTGFAAVGLLFFYFAYKYNILYVYSTGPDTRGMLYARAIRQLFVGLYIANICIIGLIGIALGSNGKAAIGPFILAILLFVITALYQIALSSAIKPLLSFLPKSLEAEERNMGELANNGVSPEKLAEAGELPEGVGNNVHRPAPPRANMLTKFLKPHVYDDYAACRRLMPMNIHTDVDDDTAHVLYRDAYLPPAVWTDLPRLIVPRDPAGISGPEVLDSGKIVPITDAGATLDDKNKIVLDDEKMQELFFKEKNQGMNRVALGGTGVADTSAAVASGL